MGKNGVSRFLAAVAAAALFMAGCANKPKLNLSNFRDPSIAGSNLPGGPGDFNPDLFRTTETENGDGEIGGGDANGKWTNLNSPVDVGDGASAFLDNAKTWNEKVYFDYNRYEIKQSQRPVLDRLAGHLKDNAALAVVIEGHCDERGSDEYNRALSEKRALAIRDYLNALGIDNGRMFTISYGEDKPDVPNAVTEDQHRLNRRGQFLIGNKK